MRILHMADLHFGIDLYKISLIEDQRWFLKQLSELILQQNIDVILICGDIYDTMLASKDAIELYDQMVTLLCQKLEKKVIIIAGNHDSATRLTICSDLLQKTGLYIYGKSEQPVEAITFDDICIYPIPFFHNETIARVYKQEIASCEEAFTCILNDIRSKHQEGMKSIVMAHAFISGAVSGESDRFASVGGSDMVNADVFYDIDYVALGHLHRMQKIRDHVWYSGSPIAYAFSESLYQKAVLVYDTDTDKVEAFSIEPLHLLQTYRGTFDELRQKIYQDEHAYVRLEVSDAMVSYDMLLYFQERIPHLLHISSLMQEEEQTVSLEMDALETLSDEAILRQFYMDTFQKEIAEDELTFFNDAYQNLEELEN